MGTYRLRGVRGGSAVQRGDVPRASPPAPCGDQSGSTSSSSPATSSGSESNGSKDKGASLVAQLVKNPPAVQETPVRFLGREDLLEKGKATHSSILGLPWWLSG